MAERSSIIHLHEGCSILRLIWVQEAQGLEDSTFGKLFKPITGEVMEAVANCPYHPNVDSLDLCEIRYAESPRKGLLF